MSAVSRSVPVAPWRTRAPRQNSWTIVAATKAQNAKHKPDDQTRTPNAARATAVTTEASVGHKNESRRFASVDLRHASSGAIPVSNNVISPIGSSHLLKNGGPTVSRSPITASLSVGNIVAKRTNIAENSRIQLLTRNAASLEIQESSSFR